jgi:hypothetical protein
MCPLYVLVLNPLSQVFQVLHTYRQIFNYTEAHAENSTALPSFTTRIKIVKTHFPFQEPVTKIINRLLATVYLRSLFLPVCIGVVASEINESKFMFEESGTVC